MAVYCTSYTLDPLPLLRSLEDPPCKKEGKIENKILPVLPMTAALQCSHFDISNIIKIQNSISVDTLARTKIY